MGLMEEQKIHRPRLSASSVQRSHWVRLLLSAALLLLLLFSVFTFRSLSASPLSPAPVLLRRAAVDESPVHVREDAMLRQQVEEYQEHMRQHRQEERGGARKRRSEEISAPVEPHTPPQAEVPIDWEEPLRPTAEQLRTVDAPDGGRAEEESAENAMHIVDTETWRRR